MQLILETQATEGIKINMSTQAEKSANEDFNDIKTNINNAHTENSIDDETIANSEISLNYITEVNIDGVTSETIKESVPIEEKCQGINTNGNQKCNLGVKDIIKDSDFIENINSIVNENITNGTSNSNDGNESECENTSEKNVTENVSTINKDVNPEFNLTSSSEENLKSCTEKNINSTMTKDQHPESELPSTDVTNNLSSNVVQEESSQTFKTDTDLKPHKNESFTNRKETSDVMNTTVVNENESKDVTVSKDTIIMDEDEKGDKVLPNDASSPNEKELLQEMFNDDQIVPDNKTTSINEEITKPSEVPANIVAMSTEIDTLPDESIVEDETLAIVSVKDPEDIAIQEEADKSSVAPADIAVNNKTDIVINTKSPTIIDVEHSKALEMDEDADKLSELHVEIALNNKTEKVTHESILGNEKLGSIVDDLIDKQMDKSSEIPANIAINNETDIVTDETTSENEKLVTNDVTHPEAIAIDDNMSKTSAIPLDIGLNNKSDTLINEPVLENNVCITSDGKHAENIAMDYEMDNPEVPEDIRTNNHPNFPIAVKQLEDDTMNESDINGTESNEKEYLSSKNTEKPNPITLEADKPVPIINDTINSNQNVSVQNENTSTELNGSDLKPLPIMKETHDVSMAEPTVTPVNENEISDNTEGVFLESDLNTLKANDESVINATKTSEKVDDDTEVEHVPMEVDEIEIVDLDTENQEENTSKSKTSCNKDVDKTIIVEMKEPENISEKNINDSKIEQLVTNNDVVNNSEATIDVVLLNNKAEELIKEDQEKVEIIDEDDVKIVEDKTDQMPIQSHKEKSPERKEVKALPVVCKLSNTLDILSDDEDEPSKLETTVTDKSVADKQCINIDDDDDIMLIEEDSNSKDATSEGKMEVLNEKEEIQPQANSKIDLETGEKETITTEIVESSPKISEKDSSPLELDPVPIIKNILEKECEKSDKKKPLLPQNFLKTAKKNLADMTRDELEDFCILRIVESIVDRTNLSEIKTKIKTMSQNLEDFRKRAMMLTKQNRDLQVVLKSVQEEQKKRSNAPIQPLKITRSVGMQVLMNEKIDARRKVPIPCQPTPAPVGRPARALQKVMKAPGTPTPIPVPRKVPVNNSPAKALTSTPTNNVAKVASPGPGLRNPSPVQKVPEKRTHSRMQASASVTVDLTDDEPPAKVNNKNSPIPPVRLVPQQNLLPQQRPQFIQPLNSPRKVYIPISGPQGQAIRPGQTLMMKSMPLPGPRQRVPMTRMQQTPMRIPKASGRHPAPLPDAMKQYTPPTWKALPPAPDLKLSKVENGIVISWKIDGYPESGYETIASYQLYAYQETTAPPCTALWKKIGDVKALPLPMACTLTQFMAGFKYYFAVRAVDIRSRLGPFSLPGSILLLNKV